MDDKDVPDQPEVRKGISPLATPEEREKYRSEREQELRQIIKGPTAHEEWWQAKGELDDMRFGRHGSDEEEWMFGR